jgi:hypothetical protein
MKPKLLMLSAVMAWFHLLHSQIITIQSGANLFLGSGSQLYADGLDLQPSSDLDIAGPNSISRSTTVIHPTANPYISRVYQLANTISGFSGTITVYYQDAELNGIPENALTLNIHNGNSWMAYNTGITRDGTANFVTTAGISNAGLNELTLANESSPLPLRWLSIVARAAGENNVVTWKTSDEANVKDFQVQKSNDGIGWINTGSPITASNMPGLHSYSYTDRNRYVPITFYRVRQEDWDGRSSYSKVVSVKISNTPSILLMPNPAISQVHIKSSSEPVLSVIIFNAAGSKVYAMENINQSAVTIPVANWTAGYYLAHINLNGKLQTMGFVKQ